MGCELMTYYPLFMKTIRRLDYALGELADGPDWTIQDVLLEDVQTSKFCCRDSSSSFAGTGF